MKNRFLREILIYGGIIVFVLLIRHFIMVPVRVEGPSMQPTLEVGQIMILNKTAYWFNQPERFDVVIVNDNGLPIIKRIIGLPGEIVKITDNRLYINDEQIPQTFDFVDNLMDHEPDGVVAEGHFFILGDNRPVSQDSRMFGTISEDQILGRISTSIWPFRSIN